MKKNSKVENQNISYGKKNSSLGTIWERRSKKKQGCMKCLKAATVFIWDIWNKNEKKGRNIYYGKDSEYLQT